MQTETVFLDFREFPFFLFAFIVGIMLVDSHFAAFSLYPQRLFYSADIGGSDAFVRIQDISPCSHIVKQSAARKSDEIAPHPSAFNFFSCRKFFPHIEMGFGIVYEILTSPTSLLAARRTRSCASSPRTAASCATARKDCVCSHSPSPSCPSARLRER